MLQDLNHWTTAWINPDGQIAVIVLHRADQALEFALKFDRQKTPVNSPAHSITTCCFQAE